jgi:hypothetical protein
LDRKKCIADLVPFSHVFHEEESHKYPVILFSHATAQEDEVWGRHGSNPQINYEQMNYGMMFS